MAAKNPFRVSDLIAKYGWKLMSYLSALGTERLAEAQILFVDSGHTDATDADDTEHGHSFEKPLATLDYAVGLMVASEGGVILLAPGHAETLSTSQIDLDVAGVTVIGIGEGQLTPTITYSNAADSIDIGANGVSIFNVRLNPSVTDILIAVDVESGVTDFRMEDCELLEGDGANDEFIVMVDLKSGNDDAVIRKNVFRTKAAAAGCTDGIILTAASARVKIEDNLAVGNWSTAFIADGAACTNIFVANNTIKVKDGEPGIELNTATTGILADNKIESTGGTPDTLIVADSCSWFNNTAVVADGGADVIIGGGEMDAALIAYNLDHLLKTACADTSDPVDMTAELVDDTVLANVLTPDGDVSTFDRRYESLKAIAAGQPKIAVKATGDLTSFGATLALFTVTGDVLLRITASVDVAVTSTSGTTTLEVGVAGNTGSLCVNDAVDNTAFDVGDSWTLATAADANGALGTPAFSVVGNSVGVILTGNVDDITAGDIDFYCEWIPLSADGNVVAA